MAKSTAHLALASLKSKVAGYKAQASRVPLLLAQIMKLRNDLHTANCDIISIGYQRNRAIKAASEYDTLEARVRAAEAQAASFLDQMLEHADKAARVERLLRAQENYSAKLAGEKVSVWQTATVYGVVAALASYAAGIATQLWFPIGF